MQILKPTSVTLSFDLKATITSAVLIRSAANFKLRKKNTGARKRVSQKC